MIQNFVVALIVLGCSSYALWTLMPSALRRALAQRVLHWPWPSALATRVRRAAAAPTGCGCNGCDAGKPKPAAGTSHPIRIHRQPKP